MPFYDSPESPLSISAKCQAVIFRHFELSIYENNKLENYFLIQNIIYVTLSGKTSLILP